MGGFYRSTNSGVSWTMFDHDQMMADTRAQAQFTSDPNVLFNIRRVAATRGETEPIKSTDGGLTWQNIPNPSPYFLFRLLADPNSTQRLVAADWEKIYFSSNGGATWATVYTDPQQNLFVAGAFFDGSNIFVGTNDKMLVSTNNGTTFSISNNTGLPAGGGMYSFNGAKTGSTVRLFCTVLDASVFYPNMESYAFDPNTACLGVFKMNFGAGNWTNARGNIPATYPLVYIDLPKNNPNTVYVFGLDDDANNQTTRLYKTTNGGTTWTNVLVLDNNQNITTGWRGDGGDMQWTASNLNTCLDVSDNDPNRLLFFDGGDAHISENGGTTWRQAYVQTAYQNPAGSPTPQNHFYKSNGLDITTCHHVEWLNSNEIFVCNSDIQNWFSQNGGDTWTFGRANIDPALWWLDESNWYKIARNPSTGRLFAAVAHINDIYVGGRTGDWLDDIDGRLLTSTDNGLTWQVSMDNDNPVVWVEMDPANPNILYASDVNSTNGGIFKTTNGGTSWAHLPNPPRTEGHPFNIRILPDGAIVASFGAHDDGASNYSASSGVFLSTNGGQTWLDRSHADMQFFTRDVVIDPNDATGNTWFATVWDAYDSDNQGDGRGGLYRTTNRGVNWTKIYDYFEPQSVGFSPTHPGRMYFSKEYDGLWMTENSAAATPVFSKLDGFPFARPFRIFFNPFNISEMWVTTFGGAVWKGTEEPVDPPPGDGGFQTSLTPILKDYGWGATDLPNGETMVLQQLAVTTANSEILLTKINGLGEVVGSAIRLGTTKQDWAKNFQKTTDAQGNPTGFVIAGETNNGSARDIFLIKTNLAGGVIWANRYGSTTRTDYVSKVIALPDGGFAFAGYSTSAATGTDVFVLRTNADGNPMWNTYFDLGGNAFANSLDFLPGGAGSPASLVVAGYVQNATKDAFLMRIDAATAGVIWAKNFNFTSTSQDIGSAVQVSGNEITMAGNTQTGSFTDHFLVRTNLAGGLIFSKKSRFSPGNVKVYPAGIEHLTTPGGGFVVGGHVQNGANKRAFLQKFDAAGNSLSLKIFNPDVAKVEINNLKKCADGGFLLAGTNTVTAANPETYILKTDADLNAGTACFEQSLNQTTASGTASGSLPIGYANGAMTSFSPVLTTFSVPFSGCAGGRPSTPELCSGCDFEGTLPETEFRGTVSETEFRGTFQVFPNPIPAGVGAFFLQFDNFENEKNSVFTAVLTDLAGRVLAKKEFEKTDGGAAEWQIGAGAAGVFFVQIFENGRLVGSQKLVRI